MRPSHAEKTPLEARPALVIDIAVLLIGAVASGLLAVHLGQDASWDLKNHHYYNAYAFVTGRLGFDVAPAQLQSYLNPLIELPFYFLVGHLAPRWAGFAMGALQGLGFWLLFRIASRVFAVLGIQKRRILPALSVVVAAAGVLGPFNVAELGMSLGDSIASLFVLGAVLVVLGSFDPGGDERKRLHGKRLIAAGLLLGIGAGLKLTLVVYCIGGLAAVISLPVDGDRRNERVEWRDRLSLVLRWGIGVAAGFAAAAGFWMWKLWSMFQNPLFPFYNKIFRSPDYYDFNFSDARFLPKSVIQHLFYPFFFATTQNRVAEVPFRDARLAVVHVLLGILAVRWGMGALRPGGTLRGRGAVLDSGAVLDRSAGAVRHRGSTPHWDASQRALVRFLCVFFVVSYVAWQEQFSIYRYLVPLELLTPIVLVVALWALLRDLRRVMASFALAMAVIVSLVVAPTWGRLPWSNSFFAFDVPLFEHPEDALVILCGREPASYLAPAFQTSVRFVRVQSTLTHPELAHQPHLPRQDQLPYNRLRRDIAALVRDHRGSFYLLSTEALVSSDSQVLAAYGLRLADTDPFAVVSRLEDRWRLYELKRQ